MPSQIAKIRRNAYQRQSRYCYYCQYPMWQSHRKQFARDHKISASEAKKHRCTAEHLTARCAGGSNAPGNIVAACEFCNQQRHYMSRPLEPGEYIAHVRRELAAGRWHGRQLASA